MQLKLAVGFHLEQSKLDSPSTYPECPMRKWEGGVSKPLIYNPPRLLFRLLWKIRAEGLVLILGPDEWNSSHRLGQFFLTGVHIATIFKVNFWNSLLTPFEDTAKKGKEVRNEAQIRTKWLKENINQRTQKDTCDRLKLIRRLTTKVTHGSCGSLPVHSVLLTSDTFYNPQSHVHNQTLTHQQNPRGCSLKKTSFSSDLVRVF